MLIIPLNHGITSGVNFHFCLSGFPHFFFFLNNVFGLDLTEAYLCNKHEGKRENKLTVACHASHKSSPSLGMFGVRGGGPLEAKAMGPLQCRSLENTPLADLLESAGCPGCSSCAV